MPNPTRVPITQPRIAFLNPETGFVSQPWYLFLLSLNQLTGNSNLSLDDVQKSPTSPTFDDVNVIASKIRDDVTPSQNVLVSQITDLTQQIQSLQLMPQVDVAAISAAIAALNSAPVTYTADFSVGSTDRWIINNKAASSCTATLPAANMSTGRVLYFQNYQAQTLVSGSSNVVPLVGGAAGTAILTAVIGNKATLVSDGTNWIITQ